MKIYQLKQKVYQLTFTKTTKELKTKRPELIEGKDLRKKNNWITIYSTLKLIDGFQQDQTSREVSVRHEFKSLDRNSSFDDLLHNVRALGRFYDSLETKIDKLEQSNSINQNEF